MATNTKSKPFDQVGFIMDWESGDMTEEKVAEGFQHLVDSGIVWSLQGAYGRQAARLINYGYITDTHNRLGLKDFRQQLEDLRDEQEPPSLGWIIAFRKLTGRSPA